MSECSKPSFKLVDALKFVDLLKRSIYSGSLVVYVLLLL